MGGDQSSSAYVHAVPATGPGFTEDEQVGVIHSSGNKGTSHSYVKQKQGERLPAEGWGKWEVHKISSNEWYIFCSEVISDASISKYILADFSQEGLITEPWANVTKFHQWKGKWQQL